MREKPRGYANEADGRELKGKAQWVEDRNFLKVSLTYCLRAKGGQGWTRLDKAERIDKLRWSR